MKMLFFTIANLHRLAETLQQIKGVLHPDLLEPLYPDTQLDALKGEYYVALGDVTDLALAAKTLNAIPGVDSVEAPTSRGLIW